jgi:hypothetical protein
MKNMKLKPLYAALFGLSLALSAPAWAEQSAMPAKPQEQSEATKSIQPDVDKASGAKAQEKRKAITADAIAAVEATQKALLALEEKKPDDALKALEQATGKLELLLARKPELGLAPVAVNVQTFDLLARPETVKAVVKEAEDYLEDGAVQQARELLAGLASEIVFSTTSIPLATYPDAIKAVSPLIDAGKIDEAKAALRAVLNTLVITDEIIPLPVLRADYMLAAAKKLSENMERSDEDNKLLERLLKGAQTQLELAEALGYGNRKLFKPMYKEIKSIQKKSAGGKGGKGWFDELEKLLGDLTS